MICHFENRQIQSLPNPRFRCAADDGTPVLAIRLDHRDGVIPLRDLPSRFGIIATSHDGQMLRQIGAALDFVHELRIGDPLPAEILGGDASWAPDPIHRHIASDRLRGQLLQWLRLNGIPSAARLQASDFDHTGHDPDLAQRLHAAFDLLASQLQMPHALDVLALLESLSEELAYIEALRERLLRPVRDLGRKLESISRRHHPRGDHFHMITQVRRLCFMGLSQIGRRFGAVDNLTTDVIELLTTAEKQWGTIRTNRNWLYRSYLAFAPILQEWQSVPHVIDDMFWPRLARTYRFLAPRFMAMQEWKRPPHGLTN